MIVARQSKPGKDSRLKWRPPLPTNDMRVVARHFWKGVIISALTLVCMELATRLIEATPSTDYQSPMYEDDNLLGYRLKARNHLQVSKKIDDTPVYQAFYSTDEQGRRVTPGQDRKHATRAMLFFGCSFTFGEGVQDNQTLPFYTSQLVPNHRIYNYGVPGYGSQHMLEKLQSAEFPQEIEEKEEAVLVYTFLDSHIARIIGRPQVFWGRHFPYYRLEGERLVRHGSFLSARPILTGLYDFLGKSSLVRYLATAWQWPPINDDDIKLTARIIEESRNTFRDKFRSDRFYVLFYPLASKKNAGRLIPYLKKAGIRYFHYSTLTEPGAIDVIPNDPHPSAESYRAVASILAKDIGPAAGQ